MKTLLAPLSGPQLSLNVSAYRGGTWKNIGEVHGDQLLPTSLTPPSGKAAGAASVVATRSLFNVR